MLDQSATGGSACMLAGHSLCQHVAMWRGWGLATGSGEERGSLVPYALADLRCYGCGGRHRGKERRGDAVWLEVRIAGWVCVGERLQEASRGGERKERWEVLGDREERGVGGTLRGGSYESFRNPSGCKRHIRHSNT